MLSEIPFYDLYGESFDVLSHRFIHIEDISQRSKKLSWKIAPHRHQRLLQMVFVFGSDWRTTIDEVSFSMEGNWVAIIPPGVVHSFEFQPDVDGFVLSVHREFVAGLNFGVLASGINHIIWHTQTIELTSSENALLLRNMLLAMKGEMASIDEHAPFVLAQNVTLMLVHLLRQTKKMHAQRNVGCRETRLMTAFREKMETHYLSHTSVSDYAKLLHVSISTLNRVCQKQVGKTPKSLIMMRVFTEAKRRLLYTQQTLDEIAYALGFKDTGYFCRHFKKMTSLTPSEYRRTHRL